MKDILTCDALSVSFDGHPAVCDLTSSVGKRKIIGLLGRNGSGKTTLLHTLVGLILPDSGSSSLFGVSSRDLGPAEMRRIGFVHQEGGYIETMNTRTHLDYIGSFYPRWDREREERLLGLFELDVSRAVGDLSTGDKQKLGIILAVCHHPEILLLDEPASALDPIVRRELFQLLFEVVEEDDATILISSHILMDVEKVIDHVWFLRQGRLVIDQPLDTLQESFVQWDIVAENGGSMPLSFDEPFVVTQSGAGDYRRLIVRANEADPEAFGRHHRALVTPRPMNLESLFPVLSRN